MFEPIIPGLRNGMGKLYASSAYKGCHVWKSGIDSDGYVKLSLPYSSVQAFKAVHPIDKLRMEEDLSDTSSAVDLLSDGDTVVYFEGGEYETDKFDAESFGLDAGYWADVEASASTVYGRRMYSDPGSSTATGTTGWKHVVVGYGSDASRGYLYGDSSAARGTGADMGSLDVDRDYIGYVTGIHYSDSADAKLRYRIAVSPSPTENKISE